MLIGSGVTRHGAVATSAYATAKSALEGLASALKWEGGESGILSERRVAPGLTVTEGNLERFPDEGRDRFRAATPSGRLSVADDVAPAVAFLGSPANTNITGAYLPSPAGATRSASGGRRVRRRPTTGSGADLVGGLQAVDEATDAYLHGDQHPELQRICFSVKCRRSSA